MEVVYTAEVSARPALGGLIDKSSKQSKRLQVVLDPEDIRFLQT